MKNRWSVCLVCTGILLLAAAAGLLVWNLWDDWRAGQASEEVLEALTRESALLSDIRVEGTGEETAAEEPAEPEAQTQTVSVEGQAYLGVLSLPTLDLELPVLDRWSYRGLKQAPARYTGQAETGDLILCGHNYSRHFGRLHQLRTGDSLRFTDAEGIVYRYTVSEVLELRPDALEELNGGDWDLTLFTCTPGGRARVVVRCLRTDGETE